MPGASPEALADDLVASARGSARGAPSGGARLVSEHESDAARAVRADGPAASGSSCAATFAAFRAEHDLERVVVVAVARRSRCSSRSPWPGRPGAGVEAASRPATPSSQRACSTPGPRSPRAAPT
ncbi:MAG: hypothetical protein R3F62_27240 [Planctomycetota bacterium]